MSRYGPPASARVSDAAYRAWYADVVPAPDRYDFPGPRCGETPIVVVEERGGLVLAHTLLPSKASNHIEWVVGHWTHEDQGVFLEPLYWAGSERVARAHGFGGVVRPDRVPVAGETL